MASNRMRERSFCRCVGLSQERDPAVAGWSIGNLIGVRPWISCSLNRGDVDFGIVSRVVMKFLAACLLANAIHATEFSALFVS